ncbi:putative nucleoporin nup49 protein [Neofusicoccum parvum UCRNP2]|uniref:Putative nucleoporin nup49 protein n=1 Tax=Botryosphaeria parva (strain UCR-NP2) TaxID=1287680 RepID=R1G6N9_BOTPV|nr:putative nucleoporin nup49 protein [Neofusicoccum parvum UCRNP2]
MSFGTGLGKGGGLSINTGGGSSLFGNSTSTSQPQSGGSLFGAGTSTSTSQPQSSGGLFGTSTNNATPQAQGNSLFGGALNKPATPATTTSTGGLFGGGATGTTPASQPQTGGSLFGGALGQNQQQGQQQQQPPQQQQQGAGLFGQSTQTAQTATPSLFGSSTAQTQNKPSLFSNTTNTAQQPQQTSLFGSAMNNTQQPAAGGLFGASAQNPNAGGQATIPGVRIDLSQIRGSTRFSDLHEDVQKQIEQMDALIQQQISHHDQCQAFIDGRLKENISYLPNDVEWVNGKCEAVETALDNDSQAISQLKQTIKNDVENARITFRVLENLKLPTQFHYTGSMWSTAPAPAKSASPDDPSADGSNTDLVSFFSSQTDEMDKTLEHQARLLSEIEQHLRTVEANTLQQGQELMARRGAGNAEEHHENRLRELALLFNEIQKAIMNEAQNVGDCREKVIEATVGASGIGR